MNMLENLLATAASLWRRLAAPAHAALASALALAMLTAAGCGGGVGSGGTGTYASGPITGFGSIIVNDVRFDDTAASVLDDDDGLRASGDLKLGMTVEVDAGPIGSDSSGRRSTATRIRFGSELLGPVSSVDVAGGALVVMGQAVAVSAETVFSDDLTAGLGSVRAGALVEVYGLYDAATAQLRATRIDARSTAANWRIRGVVAALDTAARTLRIGTSTFAWGASVATPADLGVGRSVRLQLATATDLTGRYVVLGFGTARRPPPDREAAELKGLVTAFTSSRAFSVNGIPVDASAASFPNGSAGVVLGARVEVTGRSEAGGLVATAVELESEQQAIDRGFDFKGPIDAVDAAAGTITVRGMLIGTSRSDLRLDNGTRADLVVGRAVEVRAQRAPGAARLEATRIVFK